MQHQDSIHILVCDPSRTKIANLIKALNKLGHNDIEDVSDPNRLALAAAHCMPDLIILGDDFPDATQASLIKQLRKLSMLNSVPILIHRKEQEPGIVRDFIQQGVAGTIIYPLDQEQLQQQMRNFRRIEISSNVTHLMSTSPFFSQFSAQQIQELRRNAIARRYCAGESLLEKGDPADTFYVVLQGSVEVILFKNHKRPVALTIEAGQPFGEMGLLLESGRTAHCIAADETLVLEIGAHLLYEYDDSIRLKIYRSLAQVLATRLQAMEEVVESLAFKRELGSFKPADIEPPKEEPEPKPEPEPQPVQEVRDPEQEPADAELSEKVFESPLATPKAIAMEPIEGIKSMEDYEVLTRKVQLRTDFIMNKVGLALREMICNKLFGYLTGSKLAKHNPHKLWNPKSFHPKSTRMKLDLHLVVLAADGWKMYNEAYFGLLPTQKVVGLAETGCGGTLLGTQEDIDRYLTAMSLNRAIPQDLELAIQRLWCNQPQIEFMTHTMEDVRPETLFLVIDTVKGQTTKKLREVFPEHQIITIVKGYLPEEGKMNTFFTYPETKLREDGYLVPKDQYSGKGFYEGQTFFLPDLSPFYADTEKLKETGFCFAPIAILAQMGPDYSGITWGSKGGAEGAIRASRARFGLKGAQSAADIADAISWADN